MNPGKNEMRAGAAVEARPLGAPALPLCRGARKPAPLSATGPHQAISGQVPRSRLVGNSSTVTGERKHGRSEHLTSPGTKQALALVAGGRFSPSLLSPRRQERDNKGGALGFDLLSSRLAFGGLHGSVRCGAFKTGPKGYIAALDLALDCDLALGIVTRRAKTTGFLVGLVSVANRARPEGDAQRI